MGRHRQFTIIIVTYFLLTSCLCSQPTRSRRQKRGIMKMMMHIMWDPVRLIRYWYAYDVTKEIAKSWRKIIPTILFLPFTQHTDSHGLAKYVHPTVGVRDSNKKVKAKKPSNSAGGYYQVSAGSIKPVAIPPAIIHQALPSRYAYLPPPASIQYYSNREVQSTPKYKKKNNPYIFMSQPPYSKDTDDKQYPLEHFFVADDSYREEIPTSNVLFPEQIDHNTDYHVRQSSTHQVENSETANIQKFHLVPQQSHSHYNIPHTEYQGPFQDEKSQKISPVFHAGQEVHIVLHPIPISDLDHESLKVTSDGQAVHFVPVRGRSNETYRISPGASPIPNPVLPNSAELDNIHKEHTTKVFFLTDRNDRIKSNSSDVNEPEEKGDASNGCTKTRVTWISQNKSKVMNKNESDLKSDETARKIFSVHSNSRQKLKKDDSSAFTINRKNINMERLREDLKHGTPVLIPFNKNAYSSEEFVDGDSKNPVIFSSEEDKNHDYKSNTERSKEVFSVPIVNEPGINSGSEESAEKNPTQKLILFLKRKKHP